MITTNTGAKKLESSDNWREIFPNPGTGTAGAHNASVDAQDRIQAEVAPIINGKQCALGAASGDYVLLRNSTITGKSDGAYIATKAIPANTDIDSTYLGSPITGGMVNELNNKLTTIDGQKVQRFRCSTSAVKIYMKAGAGNDCAAIFVTQLNWGSYSNSLTYFKKTDDQKVYKEVLFGNDIYYAFAANGYLQLEDRSGYAGIMSYYIVDLYNTIDRVEAATATGTGAPDNSQFVDFLSVPSMYSRLISHTILADITNQCEWGTGITWAIKSAVRLGNLIMVNFSFNADLSSSKQIFKSPKAAYGTYRTLSPVYNTGTQPISKKAVLSIEHNETWVYATMDAGAALGPDYIAGTFIFLINDN